MKVIIIGGVAAGMSAAAKLNRLNQEAVIHVYEKGTDLSYSGCGMPYYIGGVIKEESELVARTQEQFLKNGIQVFLQHEVVDVDYRNKTVSVKDIQANKIISDTYDKLLIATGTIANRTMVPGSDEVDVLVLSNMDDMRRIKAKMAPHKVVAIIGGGYIGLELAENLRHQGLDVHIIEQMNQLLPVYDKIVASKAQKALEDIGVQVHLNESLMTYSKEKDAIIVTTKKNQYKVDFIVEAIGVRPNTSFLQNVPLTTLDNGAIVINDRCETSIPDVYAAGDCAAYYHNIKGENVFVPLGTHANKTGRVVAEQIAGVDSTFPGIVGSNIVKVADLAIAKTGIGLDEGERLGYSVKSVDIIAKHKSSYYPGATELFVRLVYDPNTGVIKGAQLVGKAGVADRINIMALAVSKGMTAAELSQMDFAYAPPFTPVWDPLLIAANQITV